MRAADKTTLSPAEQRKRERRDAIVDAAVTVFAREGFGGAGIDAVAREAGVAKGTVYLYFKSKEELFEEALQAKIVPVVEAFEQPVTGAGSAAEQLCRQLDIVYERLVENEVRKRLLRMIVAEGDRFPTLRRVYHRKVISRIVAALADTLAQGAASGEFRKVSRAHVARVILGPAMLAALWSLLFDDIEPFSVQAFRKVHQELILQALTAPG